MPSEIGGEAGGESGETPAQAGLTQPVLSQHQRATVVPGIAGFGHLKLAPVAPSLIDSNQSSVVSYLASEVVGGRARLSVPRRSRRYDVPRARARLHGGGTTPAISLGQRSMMIPRASVTERLVREIMEKPVLR